MSNGPYYQGGCGCGAVTLMACGTPLGEASCDCVDCADCCHEEGGATRLQFWPETAVQLADGLEEMERREGTHGGAHSHCRRCGERVLTEHDEAGLVEVPAAVLPEVAGSPGEGEALLVRLGHRRT